jgi:hypothetical protein
MMKKEAIYRSSVQQSCSRGKKYAEDGKTKVVAFVSTAPHG